MKLHFGDVLFDDSARRLFRNGEEVHLPLKAYELLRILIERRPDALSKNELQNRLWPDTFVSDANLPSLITQIRQAIGDDARAPRFIATLQGYGYAFRAVAAVESADQHAPGCWLASAGAPIVLNDGENIIGRDGPGVVLDSPTVSRRHARVVVEGTHAIIEDLGSKNGTFVNNEIVTSPQPLKDGDRIRVGSFLLTYRVGPPNVSTLTAGAP
jgi:DNA-binding winged helix-turn-helix (wHTH) protein